MEFGLFTEFQAPAGRTDSAAFDESMTQMRLAEDLGYVWLAELHFQKDRRPGPARDRASYSLTRAPALTFQGWRARGCKTSIA